MRRKWSYEECKKEVEYIKRINPASPGANFNNSPEVFAGYCNMQANTMEHSGFPLLAEECRQCRDIARRPYLWAKKD